MTLNDIILNNDRNEEPLENVSLIRLPKGLNGNIYIPQGINTIQTNYRYL